METQVTGISTDIRNTGVGGCEYDYASLNVMVWDGDKPGFAWDWDHGTKEGTQELYEGIHDPDVVVAKSSNEVYAHFVYEEDDDIYYEVWQYDFSANTWNQVVAPDQLNEYGPCSNPNIDRYGEKTAVVWSFEQNTISGVTGDITGNYNQPQIIYRPNSNQGDFVEPDLAIGKYSTKGISVTFKEIYDNSPVKQLWVATYEYDNFQESGIMLDTILEGSDNPDVEFGMPRIAADRAFNCPNNPWPFQTVMVKNDSATDEYFVRGYNNYSGNASGFSIDNDTLNDDEYISPFDSSHVYPVEYPTREPVVSFLEDIHVAWSYIEPETGTWEIIYRTLDVQTGEPISANNYSLVNGYDVDYGYEDYNQHHPCIASRFNYENEKFIGWLDEEDYLPEYKVRHTNTQIFGIEEKSDPSFLYPNPAHNFFRINLPEEEIQLITVYSMDGRKVLEASTQSMDISELQQGVYIVEIKSGQKTRTKQLIKQ